MPRGHCLLMLQRPLSSSANLLFSNSAQIAVGLGRCTHSHQVGFVREVDEGALQDQPRKACTLGFMRKVVWSPVPLSCLLCPEWQPGLGFHRLLQRLQLPPCLSQSQEGEARL